MIPGWQSGTGSRATRLLGTLDQTLERLKDATALSRPAHIQEVLRLADLLRRDDDGLAGLAERIDRIDASGFFDDTPWSRMERLVPALVAGGFQAGGHYAVMETLSLLRGLAVAEGRLAPRRDGFDAEAARRFLGKVVALNAWALFPNETEATRGLDPIQIACTERCLRLVVDRLPDTDLLSLVLDEVTQVAAQRPLQIDALYDRIRLAERLAEERGDDDPRLQPFQRAVNGPGPLSRQETHETAYRKRLQKASDAERREEATACAQAVAETGIVSKQNAWLARWAAEEDPQLLDLVLGLDERGQLERRLNEALVNELVLRAVTTQTPQVVDGIGRTLERGLLSRPEVAGGMRRLLDLELHPEVEEALQSTGSPNSDPLARLLGGALRILGQPLGVGQGRNPTCQSARALSIWSLNRPGYLLELTSEAARDNQVRMWFFGDLLDSGNLIGGLIEEIHPELDPVSLILVPHLDRIYGEMMRRVAHYPEDGHKWVNPAMYGRMVPGAFTAVFNALTGQPGDIRGFVERFYITHHPDHAAAHGLIYPNPVGIVVTSAHAAFVGFHAVTIQRIARDPQGDVRVYFYNPNNESRQDWGDGIVPSVMDHGEVPGESSLPFEDFATRVYAFHYDPYWVGDTQQLSVAEVDEVVRRIETSWVATGPWGLGAAGTAAG